MSGRILQVFRTAEPRATLITEVVRMVGMERRVQGPWRGIIGMTVRRRRRQGNSTLSIGKKKKKEEEEKGVLWSGRNESIHVAIMLIINIFFIFTSTISIMGL